MGWAEERFGERLLREEPLARHTTMRVGGAAELFLMPKDAQETADALAWARDAGKHVWLLGAGSNLIPSDEGVRGVVLSFTEHFAGIEQDGTSLTAQAGARLGALANTAQEAGLAGLAFAGGIPGSVGGGTAMNAGAYGGALSDCLAWAEVLADGRIERIDGAQMQYGYRTSLPLTQGLPVLRACFSLQPGDGAQIAEEMRTLNRRRREKQPLEYPSAGSVFKRPEGYFAGALIEQAGLKGLRIGGAEVSEKHAGFIINVGGATASDIRALIAEIQRRVLESSGVALETEVRIWE